MSECRVVRKALALLVLAVGCGTPNADAVQMWWDPDYGPPVMGRVEHGQTGTLWMVARVSGVAYVCVIMWDGQEGLVEVAFYGDRIDFAPKPRTREQRCDVEWEITGPALEGDVSDERGGRLRIEAATWEQEA